MEIIIIYSKFTKLTISHHYDGLMQERRNSIANALELRLSCTNPSISLSNVLVPKGDNPLFEPVMTYIINTYKHLQAPVS